MKLIVRLLFLALALSGGPFSAAVVAAGLEATDLFVAGTGGYAIYRIPALVMTPQQSLLAACEARKSGRSDWDEIDLYLRRSTDGGRTWESARRLVDQKDLPPDLPRNPAAVAAGLGRKGAIAINNPTWIADPATGETHLLFCADYSHCFLITSRDGGTTWSTLRDITATFERFRERDKYGWRVIAVGPGHGVRLSSGRLVAPVWLSTGEGGGAHRPSICATIFSEDHGASWQAGAIVASDPDPLANPSEAAVVEAAPGRVLLSIRSESPRNRRAQAWSADGATGWSTPIFVDELWEPVCMAGLTRIASARQPTTLFFSNPASLDKPANAPAGSVPRVRKNLTLRASRDGGQSWPDALVLEAGPSAYSDLAIGPDGAIDCLYECGDKGPYERLTIVRVDPALVRPSVP